MSHRARWRRLSRLLGMVLFRHLHLFDASHDKFQLCAWLGYATQLYNWISTLISESLTTGKVAKMPKEQAALIKGVSQMELDMLLVNLRMESVFVKENMRVMWISEAGLAANIVNVVKEYRWDNVKRLLPVCLICILSLERFEMREDVFLRFRYDHWSWNEFFKKSIA